MTYLLLTAALMGMVGQQIPLQDAAEGNPVGLCWQAHLKGEEPGATCDKHCLDLPLHIGEEPQCIFYWVPDKPGTWEITLIASYAHQGIDGAAFIGSVTNEVEVAPMPSYIFRNGFESGGISRWTNAPVVPTNLPLPPMVLKPIMIAGLTPPIADGN